MIDLETRESVIFVGGNQKLMAPHLCTAAKVKCGRCWNCGRCRSAIAAR